MAVRKARAVRKKSQEKRRLNLTVNGQPIELEVGIEPHQVDPAHTLAYTLRETLGLTGTKISCDNGACGCCTVLMDGKAVLSCMTLTVECNGKPFSADSALPA
jgi:aerobic-type carbon monoxide dehydrogenase small subunit (CoxS/CutS family)